MSDVGKTWQLNTFSRRSISNGHRCTLHHLTIASVAFLIGGPLVLSLKLFEQNNLSKPASVLRSDHYLSNTVQTMAINQTLLASEQSAQSTACEQNRQNLLNRLANAEEAAPTEPPTTPTAGLTEEISNAATQPGVAAPAQPAAAAISSKPRSYFRTVSVFVDFW